MDSIFLLEDDPDLAKTLARLITVLKDVPCIFAPCVEEMNKIGPEVLASSLCLLDINLGPTKPSGIDAYRWLKSQGYKGKIVFLTGHASEHPLVKEASLLGGVEILNKPVDIPLLERVIDERNSSPK
ncbi:MAG: response regulator [Bdellovibrionota bacterium]